MSWIRHTIAGRQISQRLPTPRSSTTQGARNEASMNCRYHGWLMPNCFSADLLLLGHVRTQGIAPLPVFSFFPFTYVTPRVCCRQFSVLGAAYHFSLIGVRKDARQSSHTASTGNPAPKSVCN
mmetsp:Transcript_55/g.135  ORF Transcript_55/g.135 Transcript_55/m.135 type:complete len:123 (+) Transcript_55:695-1063(+)